MQQNTGGWLLELCLLSSLFFMSLLCSESMHRSINLLVELELKWSKNYFCCSLGVVTGKYIFGPPLEAHWKAKLEEEAAAKGSDASST